jgi:hypothetical protein
MAHWQFDLDQIRKNWERATDLAPDDLPSKFARVEAPKDSYGEARALLERVRGMTAPDVGKHQAQLDPFFDRAREAIDLLEKAPPAEKTGKLHEDLDKALADLEDLIGVFSKIWQPHPPEADPPPPKR